MKTEGSDKIAWKVVSFLMAILQTASLSGIGWIISNIIDLREKTARIEGRVESIERMTRSGEVDIYEHDDKNIIYDKENPTPRPPNSSFQSAQ